MPTQAEERTEFARKHADILAFAVDPELKRRGKAKGWTTRCIWYESEATLMAVTGAQEKSDVDLALAYGLHQAAGRALILVLPEEWSGPTRQRVACLSADVVLHTFDINFNPTEVTDLSKVSFLPPKDIGGKEPDSHLGPATEWVRELMEWAAAKSGLDASHRHNKRAWSHDGQQVLTISGKSTLKVVAGINAKAMPAKSITLNCLATPGQISTLTKDVEKGMRDAKVKKHGTFGEHELQARLRRNPSKLNLEQPLLREVPAWRPPRADDKSPGRGFIDLVGLDPSGDIILVETKLGADAMMVLQGLDYWVWATEPENHEWLCNRLSINKVARTHLLFRHRAQKRRKTGRRQVHQVNSRRPGRIDTVAHSAPRGLDTGGASGDIAHPLLLRMNMKIYALHGQ